MNAEEFSKFYTGLCGYYEKEVNPARMQIYYHDLKKYSLDDLSGAWHIHRKSSNFFPGVADFVKYLEPDAKQAAALAWSELLKLAKKHSTDDSLNFTGETALMGHIIDRLGGWVRVGGAYPDEIEKMRYQFEHLFSALRHKEHDPIKLPGRDENDSNRPGFMFCGTPKCQQIGGKLTQLKAIAAYKEQLPALAAKGA